MLPCIELSFAAQTPSQLNLGGNNIGGYYDTSQRKVIYTPEGPKAIADALRVSASLTRVDVRHNNIAGDGASQLSGAVLGNTKIEVFNNIPIKEMRADSFTELNLNEKDIGVEGGMVVAGLLPAMASLTSVWTPAYEPSQSAKSLLLIMMPCVGAHSWISQATALAATMRTVTAMARSSQPLRDQKPLLTHCASAPQ